MAVNMMKSVEMIAAEKPPLKQTFEPILLASLKETIRLIS